MLCELSISNIVLIEKAQLALDSGLCVLSGETGAGKSILLDSLGLVLGARGDASLIRKGEAQGQVTALFDIRGNKPLVALLSELDIEPSDELIIRRVVTADGKSKAYLNDAPIAVGTLKRIGEMLVEIHGQHDQKTLQDTILHRDLLDEYGKLMPQRKEVASRYRALKEARDELESLLAEIAQAGRERDYLEHMQKELSALAPEPGEEERLTELRTRMMGSEKLFEILNEVIGELSGKGVIASLRSASKTLMRSPLTNHYQQVIDGLDKAAIDAEEALYQLEKIGEDSTFDAGKLERTEERLFALKAAARKFGVSADELGKLKEDVDQKLDRLSNQSRESGKLEKAVKEAQAAFAAEAEKLSAARGLAGEKLARAIQKELTPLKMEGTHFRVNIIPQPEQHWSEAGMDSVAFECATNVARGEGASYAPLSKIASGGELSRFMLALKVAMSSVRSTPTIIFDEIDTGTGGAVADAIGKRLSQLGQAAQVLVVTHLPQVAARGSQHLLVAKSQKGGKISTLVTALSHDQREEELARMLAGATVTEEARKAAQKLLEDAA